ncbi:MAG: hypothetical protein O9340_01750 [Cyclobacteriaceae bacterium]|nr:hypothetical protein [Cyclobacteriaceae bacterium]
MKNILLLIISITVSYTLRAQHQSIGLRIGDPTGVTYKKYLANSVGAIELGFGTVSPEQNSRYYRKSFQHYKQFDGKNYFNHRVNSTLVLQGRYLFQNPWELQGSGKYEWYWGVGALMKIANIDYRYTETNGNGTIFKEDKTDLDLGLEIPLGMEYTFEDAPITLFGEFGLMLELTDRPGIFQLKGALGVRYNFYQKL